VDNVSPEYLTAYKAHNAALAAYEKAIAAFRAKLISFDEFGAAQATKKIADAAFDAAWLAESERADTTTAVAPVAAQISLI
jgi:hypothetical protein